MPGYTSKECRVENVSLKTPVTKFKKGEEPAITMNIPLVSAIMQAVSGEKMAIALAKEGGISFIFGSQPVEKQAEMVRKVKSHKAGFVTSDSNLRPDQTLKDVLELKALKGHSTIAITDDGTAGGKILGLVTSRDYRVSRMSPDTKISEFMTPFDKLIYGKAGISLSEANDILWDNKLNALPIIDDNQRLTHFVFRKDYDSHKSNPNEILDDQKRYIVGAGINTRDYEERVPALVVVDSEGFRFLAEAGADFIKIGIGGGSICITREQKGIGRGQATAVIEVAAARDEYFRETGVYIPICSDGGIVYDYHMTLALAMGADFLMLGRYFARFDESPTNKLNVNGSYVKEYWGEGSSRARNWQRYDLGGDPRMKFEEGVDSYVPYAGSLHDNVNLSLTKVKSTMCNCGALSIKELQQKAKLTLVSATSIVEGGAHDVILKDTSNNVIK